MPRGGSQLPATQVETPHGLREMARRARSFAKEILLPNDEGAKRLILFAGELEARATVLETVEVKPPND